MTTLLVDGDVVCYSACENRYKRKPAEISSTTPDIVSMLRDKYSGIFDYCEEADFSDEENEKYLLDTFNTLKDIINELKEACFADEVRVAVAGRGNFRDEIFPEYKMNRHKNPERMNPFVPILRKMAAEEGLAVEAHGMEADDLLRMWAEECRTAGESFIVASIDKDLKMIEGKHYLIHKQCFFDSTPDFALRFYYEQLLMGDPTDNIGGVPGIGPVKAKSLLEDCSTEEEFQATVMQVYYSTVHQWRYALQLTGQLIYLKKHKDDWFDMSKWPEITLEDIVNKPKKSKKMNEWTLDTALAAVDPHSVTTRERWESALLYLVELRSDLPQVVSDAIDVLTNRDEIPLPEKEAFKTLSAFMKRNVVVTAVEKVDERLGAPAVAVAPVGTPSLPVFKKPQTVPILPTAVIAVEQRKPESFINTPPVAPPVTQLVATAAGIPTFNPSWKKK